MSSNNESGFVGIPCGNRQLPVTVPTLSHFQSVFENGSISSALKLNVYPNPTVNDFKIQLTGGTQEKLNVKITDLQGRALKQWIASPNQFIQFGNDLKPGAFILEVRQGRNVKVERIVKLL